MKAARSGLVYSTESGRMCPDCRQALGDCVCRKSAPQPAATGPVRVACETKGRGGKTVTVVRGLPLAADPLAQLGKQLRMACGSGGTAKEGVIEVQGDHLGTVTAWLEKNGWAVKRAGGTSP